MKKLDLENIEYRDIQLDTHLVLGTLPSGHKFVLVPMRGGYSFKSLTTPAWHIVVKTIEKAMTHTSLNVEVYELI